MSRSNHSLKFRDRRTNTTHTIALYTTKEECNSGNRWLPMLIDSHILFMPLTYYLGSTAGGGTPLRTLKNNKTYQILQNGEFYLKIQQTPNQTITLHVGGQSWTDENEHWFPYGTPWTATIVGQDGYNPGALSVSSGTLTNNDVIINASSASLAWISCTLDIISTGGIKTRRYRGQNLTPNPINNILFNSFDASQASGIINVYTQNGGNHLITMIINGNTLNVQLLNNRGTIHGVSSVVNYFKEHVNQTVPIQILVH